MGFGFSAESGSHLRLVGLFSLDPFGVSLVLPVEEH